jgi:alkylation response protein AidB-like acyl-CoA dehydrogenase
MAGPGVVGEESLIIRVSGGCAFSDPPQLGSPMTSALPFHGLTAPSQPKPLLSRLHAVMPAIMGRAAALDETDGQLPQADLDLLAGEGLLAAPLPTSLGDAGWGTEPQGARGAVEALRLPGRVSLPLGRLYEGHLNAIRLVMGLGMPAQRWSAAELAQAGRLFGVWNTEGASVSLRIENGVLRGGKILCSGAGIVERALVTARRDEEGPQQLLLVPLPAGTSRATLDRWTPHGMRASATGSIDLDGIR